MFSKIILAGTAILFSIHISELFYHLSSYQFLLVRRYHKKIENYSDLAGHGLEKVIGYLNQRSKDSALALSWHTSRSVQPIVPHLILAETGVPLLNDPRYMHSDGVVSIHSPLHSVYHNRLKASRLFWKFPDEAINEFYQSIQAKNRKLYILSDRPINDILFQNAKLEFILEDSFSNQSYILYKVHMKK